MGPLTARRAKPALPFCRTPLLERILDWLADSGVEEAVVNLHHCPETIEAVLRKAENSGAAPLRLYRSREAELLGTSGGLSRASEQFPALARTTGRLLVLNGDTLPTLRLERMVRFHRLSGGEATLLADPAPGPEFAGERRLDADEAGVITGLSGAGGPGFGFAGVWLLEPTALRHLSGRSGGLSGDLLPGLIRSGTGRAFPSRAPWFEIGTPARYLEASLRALDRRMAAGPPEGGIRAAPGARVTHPELVSPGCSLDPGARVERSVLLEEVSIGAGALVCESVVASGETVPAGAVVRDALFARGIALPLAGSPA